jgi:hypothetical protein
MLEKIFLSLYQTKLPPKKTSPTKMAGNSGYIAK